MKAGMYACTMIVYKLPPLREKTQREPKSQTGDHSCLFFILVSCKSGMVLQRLRQPNINPRDESISRVVVVVVVVTL